MSHQLIEQLLFRAESESLDFKADQYIISKDCLPRGELSAEDHRKQLDTKKSELLKDLLAMANSWRNGPGYIVLGVRENPPFSPEVVGIAKEKAFDDAEMQQFVAAKVNGILKFSYETLEYQGKVIGLFTIPEQSRPVWAKLDFGVVKRDKVYVRRGSSTAEALPGEVAQMGAYSAQHLRRPKVQLQVNDESGHSLQGVTKAVQVLCGLEGPIADYEVPSSIFSGMSRTNKNFLRELRDWYIANMQGVAASIEITNSSEFSLTDCELHLSALQGESMIDVWDSDKRTAPETECDYLSRSILKGIRATKESGWVVVEKDTAQYSAKISFDRIRPGEVVTAREPFLVLPKVSGAVKITCRLLAHELPEPLTWECAFEVDALPVSRTIEDLELAFFG